MARRLYDGDTFTVSGREFRVKIEQESCSDSPWKMCTPLAEVSNWTSRDKAPGELIVAEDRGSKRYYDFAGAVANLRAQGVSGPDAARHARSEFERFRSWCNDEWCYIAVGVALLEESENKFSFDWCGGVESDDFDGIAEIASENAAEILVREDSENGAAAFWANRGVITLSDPKPAIATMAQN